MNSILTPKSVLPHPTPNSLLKTEGTPRVVTRHGFLALLAALALPLTSLAASKPKRRRTKARRAPAQRSKRRLQKASPATTSSVPPVPVKEPRKAFRDLPVGARFYHASDADRRLFPLQKVSATHAQMVHVSGAGPAEPVAIPGEQWIIPE